MNMIDPDHEIFSRAVKKKQARKQSARNHPEQSFWFGLGMFGMVGWSVAVPALVGTFLGVWMDKTWPGRPSWTLTLMITGIAAGCLNAWFWIKRESDEKESS
jgi:ATP synthase protein I